MQESHVGRAEKPFLPATSARKGLGSIPVGSAQSRAAARSLLAAREASEGECGLHFQAVSILDGKAVDLSGLAERIALARKREETPGIPMDRQPAGRDTLATRIAAARARVGL